MNFVSDGLDCDAQLVGGGQQRRPDEEEGTDPYIDGGSAHLAHLGKCTFVLGLG